MIKNKGDDIYVYIAGKLNDDAVGYIKNLHKMINHDKWLRRLGFITFNPCFDILVGLIDGGYRYQNYAEPNMKWLYKCHAVSLVPGNWRDSVGTAKEIVAAKERNIPVFDTVSELVKWREALRCPIEGIYEIGKCEDCGGRVVKCKDKDSFV